MQINLGETHIGFVPYEWRKLGFKIIIAILFIIGILFVSHPYLSSIPWLIFGKKENYYRIKLLNK